MLTIAQQRVLALERIQADREELEKFQLHEFARFGFVLEAGAVSEWK